MDVADFRFIKFVQKNYISIFAEDNYPLNRLRYSTVICAGSFYSVCYVFIPSYQLFRT